MRFLDAQVLVHPKTVNKYGINVNSQSGEFFWVVSRLS